MGPAVNGRGRSEEGALFEGGLKCLKSKYDCHKRHVPLLLCDSDRLSKTDTKGSRKTTEGQKVTANSELDWITRVDVRDHFMVGAL